MSKPKSDARYYKEVLLPWLRIWYALEDASERIGEQEGCDELDCEGQYTDLRFQGVGGRTLVGRSSQYVCNVLES